MASLSLADLMKRNGEFEAKPRAAPLLRLPAELAPKALRLAETVVAYQLSKADDEALQKLLRDVIKRPELRDELYVLLIKQTSGMKIDAKQLARGWELWLFACAIAPPSRDLLGAASDFIHAAVHDAGTPSEALALALKAWGALKRTAKAGARRVVPGADELDSLRRGLTLSCVVYFLDGSFEELTYDPSTTVLEAVETLAKTLGLQNHATFSLFEHRRAAPPGGGDEEGGAEPEPQEDTSVPLEDNAFVPDVLAGFRAAKAERRDLAHLRLLFKKKMFRESDDACSEPAFVKLCYIQAQADYLAGNYPVAREDAAQLAALQAHADVGPDLDVAGVTDALDRLLPRQLLASRPRGEWAADVAAAYAALDAPSGEEARAGVLRIVRSLPYGNSVFFAVRRMEDPIGLLPGRTLIGINKRGIHFFRPTPKEYLHSAELRDIMQFGSSATAVFFKMRVAGTLHVFQFETRQGEDICVALQTHINDIMLRRYQKQQRAASVTPGGLTPGATPATPGAPDTPASPAARTSQAELTAIYERRTAEVAAALADAQKRLDEESAARAELETQKRALDEALAEARDALAAAEASKAEATEAMETALREADAARAALAAGGETGGDAGGDEAAALPLAAPEAEAKPPAAAPAAPAARPGVSGATRVGASPTPAGGAAVRRVSPAARPTPGARAGSVASPATSAAAPAGAAGKSLQLAQQVKDLQKELAAATEKARAAERARAAADKERELATAKLERIEKASAGAAEKATREAAKEGLEARVRAERLDKRVAELTSELATTTAALSAKTDEAAELATQLGELDELRELKADVTRKDAQTAAIIKNQRETIEQLEAKYREEQGLRKKYFNAMEELKGGIRVFARVRPLSERERADKQPVALSLPDEYTLEHAWKNEKRTYAYNAVFGPESTQEQVFEQVKDLCQSALDGYNVVCFAYGQTGSGKTFTVSGNDAAPGLMPRALRELCRIVDSEKSKTDVTLKAYMLEIYQDTLVDLLLPSETGRAAGAAERPKLDVKKDAKGWVTVTNITIRDCAGYADLTAALKEGVARRKTASTLMNAESSRSHQIFSVVIESTDLQTQTVTRGKLSFVDLAGSERVKKSGATGEQLKEAMAINMSLSALGNVINALATEQAHVPYRDHRLTMLMSDSLGGSAKTLMFCNVSPSEDNLDETQNSLSYATRVRSIKNDPNKNIATRELVKLKEAVAHWRAKAGEQGAEELEEIGDARAPAA